MNRKLRVKEGKKGAYIGIVGNLILFVIKFLIAITSGSYALIADSLHTISDALSSVVVLIGFHVVAKPADEEHQHGHGGAEAISGFIVAVLIVLIGFEVGRSSILRLVNSQFQVPGSIAILGAIISIGGNLAMTKFESDIGRRINSPSLMADSVHHTSDALSSIVVLVGIVLSMAGYPYLDTLAGFLVGIFIIKTGFDVGRENIYLLMGSVPNPELSDEIKELAMDVDGVHGVHSIKIYYVGVMATVQLHIEVHEDMMVVDADRLAHRVQAAIVSETDDVMSALVHVCPYRGPN